MRRCPRWRSLTEYEKAYTGPGGVPRYEKIVRLSTIPLVHAGWLVKNNKGRWYITEEGREACRKFPNAQELYKEALRLFEEVKQGAPAAAMVVEEAEEKAWEQVQKYLLETRRLEFRTLIAELLQAMGYHVAWIAPPEKEHGQIDMVAYTDPLGARGPRILVQIKHKGQPTTMDGMKSFLSILNQRDYGLLVSSGRVHMRGHRGDRHRHVPEDHAAGSGELLRPVGQVLRQAQRRGQEPLSAEEDLLPVLAGMSSGPAAAD